MRVQNGMIFEDELHDTKALQAYILIAAGG